MSAVDVDETVCIVDGCERSQKTRKLCGMHYQRVLTHGDPYHVDYMRGAPLEVRFSQYVERTEDCWYWTGATDQRGYGRFTTVNNASVGAHRVAYELWVGPIPEAHDVDHLCFRRCCVNPEHLEAVTRAVHNARRIWPTHCKRGGHEMVGDNIAWSGGHRRCRACRRATRRAHWAANRDRILETNRARYRVRHANTEG